MREAPTPSLRAAGPTGVPRGAPPGGGGAPGPLREAAPQRGSTGCARGSYSSCEAILALSSSSFFLRPFASLKLSASAAFFFSSCTFASSAFKAASSPPASPFAAGSSAAFSGVPASPAFWDFLYSFFAFFMVFFSSRSALEMSLVSDVDKSNSSFAFASLRCAFKSSRSSSAFLTSGTISQGSRFILSSSSFFFLSNLILSFSSSISRFALRFFSSSSRAAFRSSSLLSSSFLFASAASSSFFFSAFTSSCSALLTAP
mmetsp:Transcript_48102/g.127558  ORF Transcript_48102/g.127558 Transcript_48102/m.127558 type:complete len:259 (+) Transcript_48102:36-812(+)